MKNKYVFLILMAMLTVTIGCKTKVAPAKHTTTLKKNPYSISELLQHDTQGIVTLRGISDEMPDRESAVENSHKKAIQHLFYMGFPGTDMKNPMIRKGNSVEAQNKSFFDEFWKTGYKQYVTNTQTEYFDCETNTSRCVTAASTFKLNYNILRRDLERNKILNKIGF